MRASMWFTCIASLAACYSPRVVNDVPCSTLDHMCPDGQTCVAQGGQFVCEPIGTAGDVDASIDGTGIDAGSAWWNASWMYRQPIAVTAGTNGTPGAYAVSISFDHSTLVAASQSLATGDDVRIVDGNGVELDRVLDTGGAWDSAVTTIWFQVVPALDANATAQYWLYYGNPAATMPPANASAVFLLADSFEGSAVNWDLDPGIGPSTQRAHTGTHSIMIPPQDNTGNGLVANGITQDNVVFDMWWWIADVTGVNVFEMVRVGSDTSYLTSLMPPSGTDPSTWNIAKLSDDNNDYTQLVPPPVGAMPSSAHAWHRVTMYAYAKTMAIDVDGVEYVPTSGYATIDADSTGSVGGGVFFCSSNVWVDDATARPLVVPEPTLVLGAAQTGP
jgi:hypothetical protein